MKRLNLKNKNILNHKYENLNLKNKNILNNKSEKFKPQK